MTSVNNYHAWLTCWSRTLLGTALAAILAVTTVAQQPPGKSKIKEEEEEPAKKAEPAKQDAPPKKQAVVQPLSWGPFNLGDEAKAATNPEVKKFLQDLVLTADEVVAVTGKVYRTAPITKKYDAKEGKPLDFTPLEGGRTVLNSDQIRSVTYYEERVIEKTRQFLEKRLDAAGSPTPVSRFLQLRAAEMALVEGIKYHQGLLAQGARNPQIWNYMEQDLKAKLFAVRIDEIRALTAERDYATAEALSQKMFQATPGDRVLLDVIEQYYVKQSEDLFAENNFLQGRLILEALRDRYRNGLTSTATRRVVDRLEEQARKNFDIAKKAIEEKNRSQALTALETAEQAWPTLPGLREFRVKLLGEYSVLRIGVRTLPTVFSPLTAMTDADKMACRLIYEPIVAARSSPSATDGYQPSITEMPRRIPHGYEFSLPGYLKWSDGTPVKSDDVLRSFEFISKPGTFSYDPSLDNEGMFVVNQIDETRFTVTFKAPVIDPLSHLNFPLLPAAKLPRDQASGAVANAFARNPMGTGPYMFASGDAEEVVFKVNPHYQRPGLPGGPAIKEIRFIRYSDWNVARQALLDGRWQMLLDGTSKEMDEVTGVPQVILFTPTETKTAEGSPNLPRLTNPRICFIGFNFRKPPVQKKEVREAISLAINRQNILDTVYRGKTKSQHSELNGPYPLNSWAYDTLSFGQSPYAAVQAAAKLRSVGSVPELKLAVMAEDQHAVAACNLIKADLAKAGVNVAVVPMSANALFVEMNKAAPSYDLIYACWDFPNESLDLRALFDGAAANGQGPNFSGYQGQPLPADTTLMRFLSNGLNNRDVENARRQMYSIHKHIIENALIAPLYQLDKHVAVHRSLDRYERFHPLYVFDSPEKWILKAGGQ